MSFFLENITNFFNFSYDNQENENDTPTQVPQESQETLPTEPSNESAINNQSVSDTKTEELDVPLATDVIHVQDE